MAPCPSKFLAQRGANLLMTSRHCELPKQEGQASRGLRCCFSPPLESARTVGMKGLGGNQRKGEKVRLCRPWPENGLVSQTLVQVSALLCSLEPVL